MFVVVQEVFFSVAAGLRLLSVLQVTIADAPLNNNADADVMDS